MCNVRATARRLRDPAALTPARSTSNLWLPGLNVDTHRLRSTTRPRSLRWETPVRCRTRAERWDAGELARAEETTGEVAAGDVCAGGVADGVGAGGVGVGAGVTLAGALAGGVLAGGALAGGGLVAGAFGVGADGVDPGTVTVTAETPGVVLVAAPLRNG